MVTLTTVVGTKIGDVTVGPGITLVITSPSSVKVIVEAGRVEVTNETTVVGLGMVEKLVIVVSSPKIDVVIRLVRVWNSVVLSVAVVGTVSVIMDVIVVNSPEIEVVIKLVRVSNSVVSEIDVSRLVVTSVSLRVVRTVSVAVSVVLTLHQIISIARGGRQLALKPSLALLTYQSS